MVLDDDIFDSFFACIGAVKEAKVVSIKISMISSKLLEVYISMSLSLRYLLIKLVASMTNLSRGAPNDLFDVSI